MRVITISGKAESGKDTTAIILKEILEKKGKSVVIAHYADLLKFICSKYFNWNGEKDLEGRTLLQYVGTDVVRKKEPDYWINFVKSVLNLFKDEWDYVLIPDARFPNEIECMREYDVVSVRVERDNYTSSLTEEQKQHASETALNTFTFDYCIGNPGDQTYRDILEVFADKI